MNQIENMDIPFGVVAEYKDWTIIRNSDGLIALDENKSNVLPGGIWHRTIDQAKKSIDNFLLAGRDANVFWMLANDHAGVYGRAIQEDCTNLDETLSITMGSRKDFNSPDIDFRHKLLVRKVALVPKIEIISRDHVGGMSPEAALVLANALRRAAKVALRMRRGDKYPTVG